MIHDSYLSHFKSTLHEGRKYPQRRSHLHPNYVHRQHLRPEAGQRSTKSLPEAVETGSQQQDPHCVQLLRPPSLEVRH
jgi:hypothetical protein